MYNSLNVYTIKNKCKSDGHVFVINEGLLNKRMKMNKC